MPSRMDLFKSLSLRKSGKLTKSSPNVQAVDENPHKNGSLASPNGVAVEISNSGAERRKWFHKGSNSLGGLRNSRNFLKNIDAANLLKMKQKFQHVQVEKNRPLWNEFG